MEKLHIADNICRLTGLRFGTPQHILSNQLVAGGGKDKRIPARRRSTARTWRWVLK